MQERPIAWRTVTDGMPLSIVGRVQLFDGSPIPGAAITQSGTGVPPGRTLFLTCPSTPLRAIGRGIDHTAPELEARGRGAVTVRVANRRLHHALPGVQLTLHDPDHGMPALTGAVTDADGFAILEAEPGEYDLGAFLIGYDGGFARIRVRLGAVDTVLVQLSEAVICQTP